MKIKQLKIKGFKSFANETVLDFNEGFTAIVGPNGSGKSNLIEAIRWVMGEQSAKSLRGGRMHDVIFSGTKSRQPLNFAQVEMILENEDRFLPIDFDEVSIFRRISRTGESIYRINNQNCRLKDVVNLFLDSGLGKESFSIISQGQVEAIFNAKPEDRRAIFEEVAGVFKYKTQKDAAKVKLGKTQENLDRVQDILFELDKQIVPLKKQAEVAELYKEKKKKMSDLDIAVTVHQISQLVDSQNNTTKVKEELIEKQAQIASQKAQTVQQLEEMENQLGKIEFNRQNLNNNLLQLTQDIERNEATLKIIVEKKKHQEVYQQEKEAAISRLKGQAQDTEHALTAKKDQSNLLESQVAEINSKLDEIKQLKLELERDPEETLAELRSVYLVLMQDKTHFSNQKTYAEREIQRNQAIMDRLLDEEQEVKNNLATIANKQKQNKKQLEDIQKELNNLLESHQQLSKQINLKNQELTSRQKRLQEVYEILHRAEAEKKALIEMQENYTGYYAGVRAVMTNQKHLDGVIGTVAELIHIPKDFLIAIDTALGSSSQFIVTNNEHAAQSSISYLKQTKKGRATFLPLTSITSRRINHSVLESLQSMPGYLGIASDLVHIDEKNKKVMDHLLGNTIIADQLTNATQISKNLKQRYRVVTLEGDIISPGGSMTGGDFHGRSKTQPIFTQQEKQNQIELILNENQKTVEILKENIEKSQHELSELQNELEKINSNGVELRRQEQEYAAHLQTLEVEFRQNNHQADGINYELSEAKQAGNDLTKEIEQADENITKLEREIAKIEEQMDHLQSAQSDLAQERKVLENRMDKLVDEKQKINEELAVVNTEIRQLKTLLSDNEQEIIQLEKQKDQSIQDLASYSKEELLEKKDQLIKQREETEDELDHLTDQRQKIQEISKSLSHEIDVILNKQNQFEKELNDLEVAFSRRDVRLDYLLQYIVDEYQISYEDARFFDNSDIDFNEAKKEVKQLKTQLKALGPVNLAAIEEYQEVHERYEFLSTQQADLIAAKQKLFDTMDKMDYEVETRFEATFNEIKEQFAIVFPEMFGGGRAELQLTDPNNLLETGIEIIAQPPGKKLTRLSLLSGGERALTAISLLFAIIKVRPIPFCILDEVESSLDEANVSRFGSYLQNFDDETQFIVITHRKGTMEQADRLYGVTMQEQGVSKLVSVSLKEAERMDHVV